MKIEDDYMKKLKEFDTKMKQKEEKEFELSKKILDTEQDNVASKNLSAILKEKIENNIKQKEEREKELSEEINRLKIVITNKENLANDYVKLFKEKEEILFKIKSDNTDMQMQINNLSLIEKESIKQSKYTNQLMIKIEEMEQNINEKEKKIVELNEN